MLRGGKSAEREVSMRSGEQVANALRGRGHDVTLVDLDGNTWDALRDGHFACVFNALHGRLAEDGTVQGMLELLGLPYTGSGVLASALCMDKSRAGKVMAGVGLQVPEFEELEIKEGVAADVVERLVAKLGLPLVIKPVREGSTIGVIGARTSFVAVVPASAPHASPAAHAEHPLGSRAMSKRARARRDTSTAVAGGSVSPRQPCPPACWRAGCGVLVWRDAVVHSSGCGHTASYGSRVAAAVRAVAAGSAKRGLRCTLEIVEENPRDERR